jgi:putative endonuclease
LVEHGGKLHGMQEVIGSTPIFSTESHYNVAFFMSFYIYIIYSQKLNRYYVGLTDNVSRRIEKHNSGISTYTSKSIDWNLVYTKEFTSRELASEGKLK